MEDAVYLIYLLDAGPNRAVVAMDTVYVSNYPERREMRVASLSDGPKIDTALYLMDRGMIVVRNWKNLYEWLGRGKGWAGFTVESANELIPHWIDRNNPIDCVRCDVAGIAFMDRSADVSEALLRTAELAGEAPEPNGLRRLAQIRSNLVVTTRTLFPA
jgi:hypothetical protein